MEVFLRIDGKGIRMGRAASHGRLGRQSVGWQVDWLEARYRDCLLAITQLKQEAARKATQDLTRNCIRR